MARNSYCYVPMCSSTGISTPGKRFFCLAKGDSRRASWLKSMKRYLTDISPNSMIQVCEDHFNLEEDVENYVRCRLQPTARPRLKKDVVPHIFACQDRRDIAKLPRRHKILREEKKIVDIVQSWDKKSSSEEIRDESTRSQDMDCLTYEAFETNLAAYDFNKEDGLNSHVVIKEEPLDQNFEIGEEKPDIDFGTEENCDMTKEILIKQEPIDESYYFSDNQIKEFKNNLNNSESIANKSRDTGEEFKIDTLLSYIDAEVRKNLQKLSHEKCALLITSISNVMNEYMKNA